MSKPCPQLDPKFTESYTLDDYEVLSEEGFVPITHIHQTIPYNIYNVKTEDGLHLSCADDHKVFDEQDNPIFVKDLIPKETKIKTKNGLSTISIVERTEIQENMYDLTIDTDKHTFYTNDILSSNTTIMTIYALWVACFNNDKRVLIVANKEGTAVMILRRIRTAYEQLPNWLKPGVKQYGKTEVIFANDSSVSISTTTATAARGESCNCVTGENIVTLKDKETGRIFDISMEELAELLQSDGYIFDLELIDDDLE